MLRSTASFLKTCDSPKFCLTTTLRPIMPSSARSGAPKLHKLTDFWVQFMKMLFQRQFLTSPW